MKRPRPKFKIGQVVKNLNFCLTNPYGRVLDREWCGKRAWRYEMVLGGRFFSESDLSALTARECGRRKR